MSLSRFHSLQIALSQYTSKARSLFRSQTVVLGIFCVMASFEWVQFPPVVEISQKQKADNGPAICKPGQPQPGRRFDMLTTVSPTILCSCGFMSVEKPSVSLGCTVGRWRWCNSGSSVNPRIAGYYKCTNEGNTAALGVFICKVVSNHVELRPACTSDPVLSPRTPTG